MKLPETGAERKGREVEYQPKKLKGEENIALTTENIKNDGKKLTENYGQGKTFSRMVSRCSGNRNKEDSNQHWTARAGLND